MEMLLIVPADHTHTQRSAGLLSGWRAKGGRGPRLTCPFVPAAIPLVQLQINGCVIVGRALPIVCMLTTLTQQRRRDAAARRRRSLALPLEGLSGCWESDVAEEDKNQIC